MTTDDRVGGSSEEIHKQLVKARNEFEDSKQLIDDLSACAKVNVSADID